MTARYFKYNVPPHSGPNYHDRASHFNVNETPCAICGKPVKDTDNHPFWGIVAEGGGRWADDFEDGDGNMGAFPVGRDCHRKHVVGECVIRE